MAHRRLVPPGAIGARMRSPGQVGRSNGFMGTCRRPANGSGSRSRQEAGLAPGTASTAGLHATDGTAYWDKAGVVTVTPQEVQIYDR